MTKRPTAPGVGYRGANGSATIRAVPVREATGRALIDETKGGRDSIARIAGGVLDAWAESAASKQT